MKVVALLILFLCTKVGQSSNLKDHPAATSEKASVYVSIAKNDIPVKQNKDILSRNYVVAVKALNEAILEEDIDTIGLGLNSPLLEIKRKTVKAIAKFNDKTSVLNLIKCLDENQAVLEGGTEMVVEQALLSRELISTISKLIRLEFKLPAMSSPNSPKKFEPSNYVSTKLIKKVLEKSRNWVKDNSKR